MSGVGLGDALAALLEVEVPLEVVVVVVELERAFAEVPELAPLRLLAVLWADLVVAGVVAVEGASHAESSAAIAKIVPILVIRFLEATDRSGNKNPGKEAFAAFRKIYFGLLSAAQTRA